jgi:hypothetical protein
LEGGTHKMVQHEVPYSKTDDGEGFGGLVKTRLVYGGFNRTGGRALTKRGEKGGAYSEIEGKHTCCVSLIYNFVVFLFSFLLIKVFFCVQVVLSGAGDGSKAALQLVEHLMKVPPRWPFHVNII